MKNERAARRVALVATTRGAGGFFDDAGLDELRRELEARGDETTWIDAEPSALDAAPLRDLTAAVSDAHADAVIVARAPSAALVQALRAGMRADARLLRLSRGGRSPLDEAFDAVADAGEILRALDGDPTRAPPLRLSREELRRLPLATPSAPTAGARPMIAGPSRGCPYLVDARTSPAFADTPLDPREVQTKGCSFCLDNVGAWVAFPEEEVVSAWLAGLRRARETAPQGREIVLLDERPHPHLPAFFRALRAAGEPPVELLIKTRVDWLLEHAQDALPEALEEAARGGHVLHVYLIGFESFDQWHLDLFNKGTTVADNVEAIRVIRALGERFPASLEFRRLRAHGVILFSPWTTPESLLENARRMREVRFDELRTEALQTRLRLYPHVPLHAKAAREGLLTAAFDDGRPDRAEAQGYDASVPWRFADPRVEAIYRAANALAALDPSLAEADVLELVTSHVMRWEPLATCPDDAVAPLEVALRTWGRSCREVLRVLGPTLAHRDRELDALSRGEKRACLKEGVPVERAAGLVRAYRAMGFAAGVVSRHDLAEGGDHRAAPGGTHAIVAVTLDDATLADATATQLAVERGDVGAITRMGELLGFPACCVRAFCTRTARGDNMSLERAPLRERPDEPLAWQNNRLGPLTLSSHHLCSPACDATRSAVDRALAHLAELDPTTTARVRRALDVPTLFLDYERGLQARGAWRGDRFVFEPGIAERHGSLAARVGDATELTLDAAGVTFHGPNGARASAASPVLVEPGRALAEPARAALRGANDPSAPARTATIDPTGDGPQPVGPLPMLPRHVLVGARFGGFLVRAIRSRADSIELVLSGGAAGLRVRLRAYDSARPSLRRGPWAIDVAGAPTLEALDPRARAAVGALVESLVDERPAAPVARTPRPARAPVVCVAPWTTLEIVDPDGLVRQCCSDWTVGDRGRAGPTSLAELWNGPGYREARRAMSTHDVPALCRPICPRLYDRAFEERRFAVIPGAPAFVRNQQVLAAEIERGETLLSGRPLYLSVCPSTYCNYDCIMCLHGRTPRRELPAEIWGELHDFLPTLRALTLLGGEPLANPLAMRFLREWDRARHPDASVSIVTNGSLLGEGALKHLGRCRFGHVTVSLNAGTPEVYEAVQRGVSLDEVLANIDALLRFRAADPVGFGVTLSFVVQPANAHTLLEFGELAAARGLSIRLLPLSPRGPEGLDYYDDRDAVARVDEHLAAMRAWALAASPSYLAEIDATREAIRRESDARREETRVRLPLARQAGTGATTSGPPSPGGDG